MGMIPKNLPNEIKKIFHQLKEDDGKWITVYGAPQTSDCPNCLSDHTGASVGIYDSNFVTPVEIYGTTITPQPFTRIRCPVCSGKGFLEYANSTRVHAIVRWNPPDELSRGDQENTPGGLEDKNVCRVKADKKYYDILRDAKYAIIDGVKCELYLPPTIRHISQLDVLTTAYFISVEVGGSVREG